MVPVQVWHPNISSQTGAICLDILKDEWSPALGIKTALLSLQLLLQCPEPDDPQDAVVAKQYISDRKEYEQQALNWTSMAPTLLCSHRALCLMCCDPQLVTAELLLRFRVICVIQFVHAMQGCMQTVALKNRK
jgi:hypothetical protein